MANNDYSIIGYSGVNSVYLPAIERTSLEDFKQNYDRSDIIDETETDIDFMLSLYRNTNPDYFLGGWIIKPIVEIMLYFTGVPIPRSNDKSLQKLLQETYKYRKSELVQAFRETGIIGECFIIVGWDESLSLPTLQVKNKNAISEIRYENFNDPNEITYINVRDCIKSIKTDESTGYRSEITIDIEKIFWKEKNPAYEKELRTKKDKRSVKTPRYIFKYSVRQREQGEDWEVKIENKENPYGCIPVVKIDQNKLSSDKSGYSDASGLINIAGVYHQVLEGAIDTNIYNGKPTTVFTGLQNAKQFVAEVYGNIDPATGQVIEMGTYELFGSYYLEGGARMEYVQINDTTPAAKNLLELLFYIFVQVSGVPEWALGAHINGTWASTKMQSTPLMQKIDSKRMSFDKGLFLLNFIIAKISEANSGSKFSDYKSSNDWGKTLPEDKEYILNVISEIIPLELLTDETILTLLDIVPDPKGEIERKKKENKDKAESISDEEGNDVIDKIKEKVALAKENNGEMSGNVAYKIIMDALGVESEVEHE